MLQELGNKIRNFRKKLSIAMGGKKITQLIFGDMYGGYSKRKIASYELGEVDPPASLLYRIWKSGNSIDGMFAELPVEEKGAIGARELYENAVQVKLEKLEPEKIDKIIKEVGSDKANQNRPTQETLTKTSGKPKGSHRKAGGTKKR